MDAAGMIVVLIETARWIVAAIGLRAQAGECRAASIVVTDMVGSTAFRVRRGDDAADALRREHDALLGAVIRRFGGRRIKHTGDGLIASFGDPAAALSAACAMQHAVDARNAMASDTFEIRVGVTSGEVLFERGDCFGMPVIEATRLCDAARPGQVLVSAEVRLAAGAVANIELAHAGRTAMKGLDRPVPTFAARLAIVARPQPAPVALAVAS